jgi:hypothetical protein
VSQNRLVITVMIHNHRPSLADGRATVSPFSDTEIDLPAFAKIVCRVKNCGSFNTRFLKLQKIEHDLHRSLLMWSNSGFRATKCVCEVIRVTILTLSRSI